MIAFLYLDQVLCWLSNLPTLALVAIVNGFNLIIVGVGVAIDAIATVMPNMPTYTPFMPTDALSAANWFYPFGALVTAIGTLITLWTAWLLIRIALNWLRALSG
jgi:hypothetical protein